MKINKILFFSLSLKKGGAENQLTKLALFLKNNTDFEVSILYFVQGNDFEEILYKNQISFKYFSLKKPNDFFEFVKYIRSYSPSLIISFMFGANIIARFVKLFFRIPVITSVRNNEISKFYRFLYKWTYKLDNATTFNSQYALDKFINEKLTSPKKSFLVNNAVSIQTKAYIERDNDVFIMVSMAHFRPQKDYLTLFKAVSLLKKENISVKLFVLGHLYNQTWPFEMIKELGIENEVNILGFTQETEKYLDISDVLVLSSLWEGTPNAILEGMANYLPVIASDIPGSRELVTNAECGFLFTAQDVMDLKNRIIEMMSLSKEQKKQFGNNGYNYIMEHYEETKVYLKWQKTINNNLKK